MTPTQKAALAILQRIAGAKFDQHLTQAHARALLELIGREPIC